VNFFRRLALQEKKLDDSSRLNVVEIAPVSDMLPSLFPSWPRQGLINTQVLSVRESECDKDKRIVRCAAKRSKIFAFVVGCFHDKLALTILCPCHTLYHGWRIHFLI